MDQSASLVKLLILIPRRPDNIKQALAVMLGLCLIMMNSRKLGCAL